MKHYGDITKIDGHSVPLVDIVCGGSPCQDLSVAGKRAGLDGERSGLFMEQIRIIKEMRDESIRQLSMRWTAYTWGCIQPRYMVWENVPGAFSSNKGKDFKAVLEETVRIVDKDAVIPEPVGGKWPYAGCIVGDGYSVAWRIHDAQYWGVPQRRKRICLLADFGGQTAGKILFELQRKTDGEYGKQIVEYFGSQSEFEVQSVCESVPGNFTEGGKQGKEAAGDIGECAEETGRCLNGWDIQSKHIQSEDGIAESLYAGECRYGGGESYVMQAVSFQERAGKPGGGKGILTQNEKTGALATHPQSVCFGISSYDSNSMKSSNPNSGIYEAETTRTLDNNGGNPACNQGGMIVLEGNGARESHKGNGYKESETMFTLNTVEQHAVCIENHPNDSRVKINDDGTVQTLSGRMGTGGGNVPMVMHPEKTGSLCASGYDKLGTQEAANDMFVVQKSWDGGDISPTLTANNANGAQRMPDKDNFNAVITTSHGGFMVNADDSNVAHTLEASDYKDPQLVSYGLDRAAYNQGQNAQYDFAVDEEKIGTQVAKGPGAVCARDSKGVGNQYVSENKCVMSETVGSLCARDSKGVGSVVRRLTPLECERLQGFPDGWTDIGDWIDSKGKKHKGESDAPRYKALGNSIALPFWMWLAERIRMQYDKRPTMASLFDGIGGFPLVFSRCGCDPVWASEIEEFPIAVTKIRFPDETEEEE